MNQFSSILWFEVSIGGPHFSGVRPSSPSNAGFDGMIEHTGACLFLMVFFVLGIRTHQRRDFG